MQRWYGTWRRHHPSRVQVPALLVLLLVLASCKPGSGGAEETLADVLRGYRPYQVRLTAAEHLPCRPREAPHLQVGGVICDGGSTLTPDQLQALARAAMMALEAQDWHTAGLALLLADSGESADQAIEYLDRARARDDPHLLSDLAAAYLVRGELADDPYAFTQALETADRALLLDPEAPEPRHQRALALTLLGLHLQARKDWQRLADAAVDDGWRREAEAQVERLSRPTAADLWGAAEDRLLRAVVDDDAGELDVGSLARRHPQHLRQLVQDDLLARWGRAVEEEREKDARRILHVLRQISGALRRVTTDPTLSETVSVLAAAHGGGRRSLARAHLEYAEARRYHELQDYRRAAPRFAAAEAELAAAGSPFAVWTAFYTAVIRHHLHEVAEALHLQRRLRRVLPAEAVVARAYSHWMSGLGHGYLAEWEVARDHFDRAWQIFDSVGEVENRSAMDSHRAIVLHRMGQQPVAWRHHFAALSQRRSLVTSRRIQNPISGAMRDLLLEDRPAVALDFADEWAAVAERSGSALSQTLALEGRAGVLVRLGKNGVAELARAAVTAREIPEASLRAEAEARIALARARLQAESDPRDALRGLTVAETFARHSGARQHLVPVYLLRAQLHRRLGDRTTQKDGLYDAMQEIERQRDDLSSPALRISYLDQRRDVLEQVVTFEVEWGDKEQAFEMLERMRAPALRDELLRRGLGGRLRAVPDIGTHLTDGRTSLAYLVLEDRLLVWHLGASGLSLRQHAVDEGRLARLVDNFADAVRDGRDLRQNGEELAALLLPDEPLPLDGTLVVIPDGPLHRLPLAALPLPGERGGFLIQRSQVVVAPSLNVHLDLVAEARAQPVGTGELLLVSGVEHDREAFPGLAALEGWWSNGASAGHGVNMLRGRQATRLAFLAAFPAHRAVIFGGHALTSRRSGDREGLVLAPDGADDDGFLEPEAILAGDRTVATEVVVLAGCGTGRGSASATEGVMSVARPFVGRGVPTVLASLWPVEDRATAEMTLGWVPPPPEGFAAALRKLQIEALSAPDEGRPLETAALAFQVFGSAGRKGTTDGGEAR